MADRTGIEWTEATWNPLVGCDRISDGCTNCYAAREAAGRLAHLPAYNGLAVHPEGGGPAHFTGEIRTLSERLDQPIRWRRPRRVFVNSTSDLFHAGATDEFIAQVFAVMALAPQHTFQVLTKRSKRMAQLLKHPDFWLKVIDAAEHLAEPEELGGLGAAYRRQYHATHFELFDDNRWPLPNVHLGVSIEGDRWAFRADHLRATPAALRWISAEPLLGPLPSLNLDGIDWVVAGGETGPQSRPMHPNWVRDLRDRCAQRSVTFTFKQWGDWTPRGRLADGAEPPVDNDRTIIVNEAGNTRGRAAGSLTNHLCEFSNGSHCEYMERVGKRAAGRLLDGVLHDELPT